MTDRINLSEYLTPDVKVFTGRDRGKAVREKSKIDQRMAAANNLIIEIPQQVRSINPSFLEGFLINAVRNYGREGFLQRVGFTKAERYDVADDLEEAIDRILTEENALAA